MMPCHAGLFQSKSVVVVVVVVVVGVAYDCLCTLELRMASMIATLTRSFGGFSAQCFSKLFVKEFTVLLLTTALGREFQVDIILIG